MNPTKRWLFLASLSLLPLFLIGQQENLPETLHTYFEELRAVTKKEQAFWNKDLYGPILLVNPQTRAAFANVPDPGGHLIQRSDIYTGILPDTINIANTSTFWSGQHWAMVILPLSKNRHQRLNLLAHELFHLAQPALGFQAHNPSNDHLDARPGRVYLRLELEALIKALETKSRTENQQHLQNALIFRAYRQQLFSKATSTENLLELNEGICEYTGLMLSQRSEKQVREHLIKRIQNFFKSSSFVRSFAYETIPVYGFFLQTVQNNWHHKIDHKTDLTSFFCDQFKLELPEDLAAYCTTQLFNYNGEVIQQEEEERYLIIQKKIAEVKNKFIEYPHLTIPFEKMNISFDYRIIFPLEAFGTVYPQARVTDNWGILTIENGALINNNWSHITLSKPLEWTTAEIKGDGWILNLKAGYEIKEEAESGNYSILLKED